MQRERLAVEFGETESGGEPETAIATLRDRERVAGADAGTSGEILDAAGLVDAIDAEVGRDPDVAFAILMNVANAVVRESVGDGEEFGRAAGDANNGIRDIHQD